jgi:phosphatidylglycerophosphatase A
MKNAQLRPMNKYFSLANLIATGFYVGKIPIAPGTFGSLLGLILLFPWYGQGTSLLVLGILCTGCFGVGLWATQTILTASEFQNPDPKEIVVDEILGQWLTVLLASFFIPVTWKTLIICFIAFRVFDIVKPFPIDYMDEKLAANPKTAALGVMMDDCVAALFAAFWVVVIIRYMF